MTTPLSFLTSGDAGVTWGLIAAVGSLVEILPAGTPFNLTVLDGGFPAHVCERLAGQAARRHGPAARLDFVPFHWPSHCRAPALEGSLLTYARLFVADHLKDDFCVYFDTDIVFLENPAPLLDAARARPGHPVWAVPNYPDARFQHQIGRQSAALAAGSAADEPYFNAGFLVINIAEWRRRDALGSCLALAEQHQFISHDQDALNVFFRREWARLPSRWNHQLYERHDIPADAALLHYSGRNKPWHCGYPPAARRPFVHALAGAGWPDWRPKFDLRQYLRNSSLRPLLARAHYSLRKAAGLSGTKPR